jgi:peptidoglycan/LPS O-acetylase OafA/YrhL
MQEPNEPKGNTWKHPLKGWRWVAGWAVLIACLAALTRIVLDLTTDKFYGAAPAVLWLLSIGIALAAAILIGLLVRCLSSWRNFKRLLLGLACLAGLIVLFYAEEDIRGRLAWGQFKARWEAKGEKFDLAAFIPSPVPDDQNFAVTPVVSTT